ncbi:nitroreductase family deazaflavin-dependent oxidoreductase [Nocardia yamanashiensis]|uniref:nitroreductase family deazaflavin-dependent oxidoreductase n=1 Tax=Nocardia yamanashiensis TaxID=209247 RepID=UPI000AFD0CAA|nr:nitroreductase family deazaflavin-dependent oxidoreductase [Nocardia yamanashiensis]
MDAEVPDVPARDFSPPDYPLPRKRIPLRERLRKRSSKRRPSAARPGEHARWNPLPSIGRALARRPIVMRTAPAVVALEKVTRRLTKGRKGVLDLAGLPALQLTVNGRRTGLPRTVTLLYVPDLEDNKVFLLIGSNWGQHRHPSWSANLTTADHAELHVNGEHFTVNVRQLTGIDRERAWQRALTFWPGYAMEQRLAGNRRFRLFELTRA